MNLHLNMQIYIIIFPLCEFGHSLLFFFIPSLHLCRAEALKSSMSQLSGVRGNNIPSIQQRPYLSVSSSAAATVAQQQPDKRFQTLGPLGLSLREGEPKAVSPSMPRKAARPSGGGGGDSYTKEELQVLR